MIAERANRCDSLVQRTGKMLYQLLPFFLAARTSVMNNDWKYGPEYTFYGHVKMITALDSDEGLLMGNKMIFNLKCRPRSNDTLSCRFEDTNIAKIIPGSYDSSGNERNEEFKTMNVMSKAFEIRFNEQGIDSYVIEKTDPPLPGWCLDMTRLVGNQLHVGANIADIGTSTYRALENFTTGECEVDFSVSRKAKKFVSSDEKNYDRGFELVALENLGKLRDGTIEIEKKRDVNDCLLCADYFFGTRYTYGIVYRDVFTKLKSSISRLFVSKTSFVSETTNEVELFGQDRQRQGDSLDHIMISLESVLPAREALRILRNPVDMDIIANRPGNPNVQ